MKFFLSFFHLFLFLEETNSDESRTSSYDDYANQIDTVIIIRFSINKICIVSF